MFGKGGGCLRQSGGEGSGVGDAVVEGQDAAQLVVVDGAQGGNLAAGQVQSVDAGTGSGGEPVAQVCVGDDGDEDLVVGEQPEIDGVGEVEVVGDGTEEVFVVHRGHCLGGVFLAVGVPDAGGGGQVEATGGGDLGVVVDGRPGLTETAGCAVGLVDGGSRWSRWAAMTAGREA